MTSTTLNRLPMSSSGSPSLLSRLFHALGAGPTRALTRAEEAAEVRAMATRVRDSDPGFANDLYAAADRHELSGQ